MRYRLLLLLICVISINYAQQNRKVLNRVTPKSEILTISKHYVYSTKNEIKEIDDVLANEELFNLNETEFVNSGMLNHFNWIKINLFNTSNETDFIFEFNQTYIDSLQLHVVKNNVLLKSFPKKGLHFPQNNEPSFLSNKYAYIYPISIAKNDTISIYIRAIVNDGPFRVMNKIWTSKAYEDRKSDIRVRTSYLLIFGGFTCLVLILSIAMFFFSKHNLYLYYAGFVFVVFLNLLVIRHFFSPLYVEKYLFFGNNFTEMFGLLQVIFVSLYAIHFLPLKKHYPKLFNIIKQFVIAVIILFVFALFLRRFEWFYVFSYYLGKGLLLFVTIFFYVLAIKLLFKKSLMAIYFVIAYLPLAYFVVHFVLTALKLTTSFNILQWEMVIFIEVFVLTIAMAHRYYLLMKENIVYQNKIFEQRLKISRDLHDNIGAQLTFIISSIDNLKYGFKIPEKLEEKLKSISAFTTSTIYELRDTIWAMNKNEIRFEDLQSRISNFIDQAKISAETIRFHFNVDEAIEKQVVFSSVEGMNLYRIIQEAINNAIKYAEPTLIEVAISKQKESLEVLIKDNGKGFDAKQVEMGNGINNMKKRSIELHAKFILDSKINKGTTIQLLIPINT